MYSSNRHYDDASEPNIESEDSSELLVTIDRDTGRLHLEDVI